MLIPNNLQETVGTTNDGKQWLNKLNNSVKQLTERWSLNVGTPIEDEASCSWVAPCTRANGMSAILKLGFPHMEAENEIDGLEYWQGDPTVYLLERDRELNGMLLEQCKPGRTLRTIAEEDQDIVIAGLLKRMWRKPGDGHPFRPLSEMINYWREEASKKEELQPDKVLVEEGRCVFSELLEESPEQVLLATDLHAGNVLSAQRMPWLVIDPKPFVGDPCYDATQHLLNCRERLMKNPEKTITRFANLLDLDERRVRLWLFARLAVESDNERLETQKLARRVSY